MLRNPQPERLPPLRAHHISLRFHCRQRVVRLLPSARAEVAEFPISMLLTAWIWHVPWARPEGNAFFAWHDTVGLLTLGIVTVFWLRPLVRRSETAAGALFPWLSPSRRQTVWQDLRDHMDELRRFRLKHADESALASTTDGLVLQRRFGQTQG